VEHVHVHSGGQAVVGMVGTPGTGDHAKSRTNPVQGDCPRTATRDAVPGRGAGGPCQSPAMPNGRCRMHGGPSPGRSEE
jgi:hypothetical protein